MKKKLMIVLISLISILLILTLSLTCCKSVSSTATTTAETTGTTTTAVETTAIEEITKEPITINFWTIAGPENDVFQVLTKMYTEEHPNVTFNITIQDQQTLKDFTPSALAAGTKDLDLLWFWADSIGQSFAKSGYLLELGEYFDKYGWWDLQPSSFKKDLGSGDLGNFFLSDDYVTYPIMYYNKTIFNEVGVTPPTTLEDFFTTGKKIKAAGYGAWAVGNKEPFQLELLLDGLYHRFLSEEDFNLFADWFIDPNRSIESAEIIKSKSVIDTFAFLARMSSEELFNSNINTIDDTEARLIFTDGNAAIYMSGDWGVSMLRDEAPAIDLGYFVLPPQNGNSVIEVYPYNSLCVPANISEEKIPVVIDFMNRMLSKEYALEIFKAGMMASNISVSQEDIAAVADPMIASISEDIKNKGSSRYNGATWDPAMVNAQYQAAQEVVQGTMTPEEAAQYIYDEALKAAGL